MIRSKGKIHVSTEINATGDVLEHWYSTAVAQWETNKVGHDGVKRMSQLDFTVPKGERGHVISKGLGCIIQHITDEDFRTMQSGIIPEGLENRFVYIGDD